MFGYKEISIINSNGKKFYYNEQKIKKLVNEIKSLLKESNINKDYLFEEIYTDIHDKKTKQKSVNLYNGYKFIVKKPKITEENLYILYGILNKDMLDEYELENTKQYREKEVYITKDTGLASSFKKGINSEDINKYMKVLFNYINEDNDDILIKSQIMHFYFVYIHPYFDGNGRTSRTLSKWYLLNNKKSSYVIFNRGIDLDREGYVESIKKSRKGNLTHFLEFVLNNLKKELEKEITITKITNSTSISKEEYKVLEYILSIEPKSIKELKRLLQIYSRDKYSKELRSLIEKNIIEIDEEENIIIKEPEKEDVYGSRTNR